MIIIGKLKYINYFTFWKKNELLLYTFWNLILVKNEYVGIGNGLSIQSIIDYTLINDQQFFWNAYILSNIYRKRPLYSILW